MVNLKVLGYSTKSFFLEIIFILPSVGSRARNMSRDEEMTLNELMMICAKLPPEDTVDLVLAEDPPDVVVVAW